MMFCPLFFVVLPFRRKLLLFGFRFLNYFGDARQKAAVLVLSQTIQWLLVARLKDLWEKSSATSQMPHIFNFRSAEPEFVEDLKIYSNRHSELHWSRSLLATWLLWVNIDHLWSKLHTLRQLGLYKILTHGSRGPSLKV
jgi:hypothetical protein